ncbi:MAG: glycosyltransferase family 1 protein, partial [Chloroflexi bacterium]|nr:glycosyltransferase family 1 protein [Chloroflexota bacterium]
MRLAFILPRYGPEVMGGAETLARGVVERLAQRGHHLEVWTTCVQNIYTWANAYPAGVTQGEAVTLRRFPVEVQRRHDLLTEPLSLENQYLWADNLPYSPELN